ncbi:hypothetical protein CEE37_11705 [candidate division LCP-89 bacterium B3_LCP]|uniref:LiaF transmembrane domain-containing protein n=1 Tax=candidate division LCP-89 bacterium B3_LCP TaxID=2012998 RepID=A0A532UVW2_UNCL8|nr:MAG: hypothetical protein CEE37_11705 [candidate division LCP-89 bacterium B3_LCP]
MTPHKHSPILGWILLILGGILLFHHWDIFRLDWINILIILGIGLFLIGIFQKSHTAVFPGTFLFLLGLLFYLQDSYVIRGGWSELWPLILLFLGVAFITLYIFNPADRGALWPGIILIAISFFFLFFPWSWFDIACWVSNLWPILLIIAGLLIIRESRQKNRT